MFANLKPMTVVGQAYLYFFIFIKNKNIDNIMQVQAFSHNNGVQCLGHSIVVIVKLKEK